MLKELSLKNFTAFGQADFKFCSGLNVIVGENGTGKTHVLKLGYLISGIWHANVHRKQSVSKEEIERYISERLLNLFRAEKIGNLARNSAKNPAAVAGTVEGYILTTTIRMPEETPLPPVGDEIQWEFSFSDRARKSVGIEHPPERLASNAYYGDSVFLPSKEMISFFEGFLALYDKRELPFDETFRDLALALSASKLKEKPELLLSLIEELEQAIGGKIVLDGGRFYIVYGKDKKREITLLAEGLRKLATILQLIENGSLEAGGTLFWDEPESNLNPRLIKLVAELIFYLCRNGIQVVIATHSLFLLRELEILGGRTELREVSSRYFALNMMKSGVKLSQGDSADDIDPLVMLDESLQQSDRFLEMEANDD